MIFQDLTPSLYDDLLDLTALAITADADHLQFAYDGTNTHVLVDVDGGVDNFVEIAVLQKIHMTASDTDNYHV
ncbi:MAG: hypothetical protein WC291_06160 [Thermodesulfovibrionales bacterium]|jgi:hypothetical protein